MSERQARPNPMVPLAGIATGVITVVCVNFFIGRPVFPWSAPTVVSEPDRGAAVVVAKKPDGGEGESVYKTVCGSCHQADGKGLPGAFPALAGSTWVTADPETPIRIVLKGLGGPIEVNGQTFNSMMPAPAGLDDKKISEVVTFVRSAFGNSASAVTAEQVAKVRAEIEGRASTWTSEELTALRAPAAAVVTP